MICNGFCNDMYVKEVVLNDPKVNDGINKNKCMLTLLMYKFAHPYTHHGVTDETMNPSTWNPPNTKQSNSSNLELAAMINAVSLQKREILVENGGDLHGKVNHSNMCPLVEHVRVVIDGETNMSYSTGVIVSIFINALWVESLVYRIVTAYI